MADKKSTPKPAVKETRKSIAEQPQSEPTIPITKAELLKLRDVARGIFLLKTICHIASTAEMPAAEQEWILDKIAEPLSSLIYDDFESRWSEHNPNVSLSE